MTRGDQKKGKEHLPKYEGLIIPTLEALKQLGGSATLDELNEATCSKLNLTPEQLQIPHANENDARTEIEYRLAWTRTILKSAGLLTNSSRGVWVLVDAQTDPSSIEPKKVFKLHRDQYATRKGSLAQPSNKDIPEASAESTSEEDDWTTRVLSVVQKIRPEQFERLSLRVLRESGFVDLTVTGRVGDGGIDGKGIVRINGVVSFHVVFQCKRYVGAVTGEEVRAFRGAMEGRADRGLFITSGRFTSSAKAEATREDARPIDLIDGREFAAMLRTFSLGVTTRVVEVTDVDEQWFKSV
ncbi:MAG: Mrr restriction system protein [Nitrospira sp.]|nr:Mrr restriction system protein [Nitrospira sp.]